MFHVLGAGYYISKNHFTGEKSPDRVTQAFEIELFTTGGGKSRLGTEVYERAAGSLLVAKPDVYKRQSITSYLSSDIVQKFTIVNHRIHKRRN